MNIKDKSKIYSAIIIEEKIIKFKEEIALPEDNFPDKKTSYYFNNNFTKLVYPIIKEYYKKTGGSPEFYFEIEFNEDFIPYCMRPAQITTDFGVINFRHSDNLKEQEYKLCIKTNINITDYVNTWIQNFI